MYPPVDDVHGHSPGGLPASGIPSAPPPPYMVPRLRIPGHGGQWSTGFCHCCDDPANCT